MLHIKPVPAFTDNYFWLFHAEGDTTAWIVDPGDATAVNQALQHHGLQPGGIVITHHHFDHTGGVAQLVAQHGVPVTGPQSDHFKAVDHKLVSGDRVTFAGHEFEVLEVPGHTLDHIAYYCSQAQVLFCGDTLFAGGCGRVFEGTTEQMHASLMRLADLPAQTQVYCAHEYTLSNLAFASLVEPANRQLQARLAQAQATRQAGRPTLPSTIALELATNPFLRSGEADVIHAATKRAGCAVTEPAQVFAVIRGWKDQS